MPHLRLSAFVGGFLLIPLAAQTPGPVRSIHISASRSYMVAGTQMQLSAVARDQNGLARTGDTFTWSAGTPSAPAVEVDASGLVTARGIGTPVVSAAIGGVRAQVQIQVIPARIDVSPRKVRIVVGDRLEFSATAFDSQGAAIQFNPFGISWQANSANGGGTQMARIESNGMLTAAAAGRVTVRAQINYPGAQIQMPSSVYGAAVIDIGSPVAFRMRRVLSSAETVPGFALRPATSNLSISVNESGQVAAQVSLDGLSNGIVLFDNGGLDLVARAGTPGFLPGTILGGFGFPVLNNRGRAVFSFGMSFGPGGIMTGARGEEPEVIAYDGLYVGGDVRLRDRFSTYAINDQGEVAFLAGYNGENNAYYTGIFKYSRGLIELVWSSALELPGAALGANVNFGWIAMDPSGGVYFTAHGTSGSALYSRIGFNRVTRVIGTGDPLAGITVGSVGALSAAPDGSVAFFADSVAVRLVSGRFTTTTALARCCGHTLLNTRFGVLLIGDFGRGQGVYLWQGDAVSPLYLTGRLGPNGEPVTNIMSAGLTATGQLITAVRTPNNPLLVIAPGLASPVLFQMGDRIDVPGNVVIGSMVDGARAGSLRLYLGGFGNSLYELNDLGLTGIVVNGDRLPSRDFFVGSQVPIQSAGGDLYLSSQSDGAPYRVRGGRLEALPRNTGDGRNVNINYAAAANDRGQALYFGNACCPGGQRLFITDGSRVTVLIDQATPPRLPEGTVSFIGRAAMDENGRVLVDLNLQGEAFVNRLYLWDSGQWRLVATRDVTQIDGVTVVNISAPRAAGHRFFAAFGLRGGGNTIAELQGDTWRFLVKSDQTTPVGIVMNGVGAYDVNGNGEMAFQANINGGNGLILFRDAQGLLKTVHFTSEPTEDGDYLLNIRQILLRDDRRIYILAADINENLVVYEATPLF